MSGYTFKSSLHMLETGIYRAFNQEEGEFHKAMGSLTAARENARLSGELTPDKQEFYDKQIKVMNESLLEIKQQKQQALDLVGALNRQQKRGETTHELAGRMLEFLMALPGGGFRDK